MTFPVPGDTLDIFVLDASLHDGPLAEIFMARDMLTGQQVVLKIPRSDILNHPVLLYHYQNEDRISRLLEHPGVVRFIHRQRSRQYIIMEYARGDDLRSRIGRNQALPLDVALDFMAKLCVIVRYIHGRGVVHLDLKPENIICDQDAAITLIDFGLACCLHLPDLLAMDLETPLGSPWYIAPEQLLGYRAGPGCDIYAMGMIFYEMLTGRLPWAKSSNLGIARRRLGHDPTPPRYYNEKIPPQIQNIILRALARHPDNRYATVEALDYDLNHWQEMPVTEKGRCCTRSAWWQRLFSFDSVQVPAKKRSRQVTPPEDPQIIGAIIDAPGSGNTLVELKKQDLIYRAEVTLVHCIEEESDSHFRRYGMTVEGEKLMARLEHAVQHFRRCSIDPSIRLIRGEVVDVLRALSVELGAKLLVLGDSRKKGGPFGSASVRSRLMADNPCKLIIAGSNTFCPVIDLAFLAPDRLTPEQVLACDIFLVDLWYEHLHVHTSCIYNALLNTGVEVACTGDNCQLGVFLSSLARQEQWHAPTMSLLAVHTQLHEITSQMVQLSQYDPVGLQQLYTNEMIPMSCRLKNELSTLSQLLRRHLGINTPPEVSFLTDATCPFNQPDLPCYGPLLKALDLQQDIQTLVKAGNKRLNRGVSGEGAR